MRVTVTIFICGLLLFYSKALFNFPVWVTVYFLWDKGKDMLMWYFLWQLSKKRYNNFLKPVYVLSLIRFLWEVVSACTGISVNNSIWVAIFFTLLTIYVLYATLKNVRN